MIRIEKQYSVNSKTSNLCVVIIELGYKDCFVAAFKDGVRMDINEAKKLTEGK